MYIWNDCVTDRRAYLKTVGGLGAASAAGCLRLSDGDGSVTPVSDDQSGTATANGAGSSGGGATDQYEVTSFYTGFVDSDGAIGSDTPLGVLVDDNRQELAGAWEGDEAVFSAQAAARYSFDVLQGDSVVASSAERVLIYAYQYVLAQSSDTCFITYQPSIRREWDHVLRLFYQDDEYTLSPEILPERNVFAFDLAGSEAAPGRYQWALEITPTDGPTETGFPLVIGTFDDENLVAVPPNDGSYPTREDAIATAGAPANASATAVQPPERREGNGLQMRESGHRGGSTGSTEGYFISRDVAVDCTDRCAFGGGAASRFRINNATTGTSLTFRSG